MTTHTSGPWELCRMGNSKSYVGNPWYTIRDRRNVYLAEIEHLDKLIPVDEFHANARLISAAPALLEACIALIEAYQNGAERGGDVDWSEVDRAHELAREAVEAAEHEEVNAHA